MSIMANPLLDILPPLPQISKNETEGNSEELSAEEMPPEYGSLSSSEKAQSRVQGKMLKHGMITSH